MNNDSGLGLGKWQKSILVMASSGSFYLNDMLGEGHTDSQYKSLHRAAGRLARDDLGLVRYVGGVVYPAKDT